MVTLGGSLRWPQSAYLQQGVQSHGRARRVVEQDPLGCPTWRDRLWKRRLCLSTETYIYTLYLEYSCTRNHSCHPPASYPAVTPRATSLPRLATASPAPCPKISSPPVLAGDQALQLHTRIAGAFSSAARYGGSQAGTPRGGALPTPVCHRTCRNAHGRPLEDTKGA